MPQIIQWNPQKLFQCPLFWYQKQHRHKTPHQNKQAKNPKKTRQCLEGKNVNKKLEYRRYTLELAQKLWFCFQDTVPACKHKLCCTVSPTLQKLCSQRMLSAKVWMCHFTWEELVLLRICLFATFYSVKANCVNSYFTNWGGLHLPWIRGEIHILAPKWSQIRRAQLS